MVCLAQIFSQVFKSEDTYPATLFPAESRYWFSIMNISKDNVYWRSEFELGCSADRVFKITANDASTFTSGFVTEMLEEKTSVNAMRATGIVNGV